MTEREGRKEGEGDAERRKPVIYVFESYLNEQEKKEVRKGFEGYLNEQEIGKKIEK